jgi:sugar lactone lactonase YvrE
MRKPRRNARLRMRETGGRQVRNLGGNALSAARHPNRTVQIQPGLLIRALALRCSPAWRAFGASRRKRRYRQSSILAPCGLLVALLLILSSAVPAYAAYDVVDEWQTPGPTGIAIDSGGDLYVADGNLGSIQKLSPTGTLLTSWGSAGAGDGQFNNPIGVATDSLDNVYVVDRYNHRIQKFSSSGTFLAKWGSTGAADSQFQGPTGIAIDSEDNVYVADSENNRIQKFSSSGTFLAKWGSTVGQFQSPSGLATDSQDNVYVADLGVRRIQKFTSGGTLLTAFGQKSFCPRSTSRTRSVGIAVDSGGSTYVADYGWNKVRKFDDVPFETTITSGQCGVIRDNTPDFSFSADPFAPSFECSIDSEAFVPCSSPLTTAPLTDGKHTFDVRGRDGDIYVDPTPARASFKVLNAIGPKTTITKHPNARVKTHKKKARVKVAFTSEDTDANFSCKLDKADYRPCTSPYTVKVKAKRGKGKKHKIKIKAKDDAGNVGKPATVKFKVIRKG